MVVDVTLRGEKGCAGPALCRPTVAERALDGLQVAVRALASALADARDAGASQTNPCACGACAERLRSSLC